MILSHQEGVVLLLHVIPNAPKSEIVGIHNNSIKIKIHAPPVDGKANAEIERLLAEFFLVSKSKVSVLKGDKSKNKKILVRGMDLLTAWKIFRAWEQTK